VKQVSGRDFAKALQRRGWQLVRIKGSHRIFLKDGRPERIVVPIHGAHPLKVGLLRAQMKMAGLTEEDL
jgi:predicted RNA binding protein YcfA (HicA-like mRNA interferase family)